MERMGYLFNPSIKWDGKISVIQRSSSSNNIRISKWTYDKVYDYHTNAISKFYINYKGGEAFDSEFYIEKYNSTWLPPKYFIYQDDKVYGTPEFMGIWRPEKAKANLFSAEGRSNYEKISLYLLMQQQYYFNEVYKTQYPTKKPYIRSLINLGQAGVKLTYFTEVDKLDLNYELKEHPDMEHFTDKFKTWYVSEVIKEDGVEAENVIEFFTWYEWAGEQLKLPMVSELLAFDDVKGNLNISETKSNVKKGLLDKIHDKLK